MPAAPESSGPETLWVPMLAFGMVVTVIGSVFWFRLKRNWNKGEKANEADKR